MTAAEFKSKWWVYRRAVAAVAILLFIAAFIFVTKHIQDPNAPQFREITSFTVPSYKEIYYDFLAPRPFEGGQAWLTLLGGTNGSTNTILLFDLERRKVIGQLLNAQPAYSTLDRSKLLCSTRGPDRPLLVSCITLANSVLRRLGIPLPAFLQAGLSGGQFDVENYWILDLNSNRADLLGKLSQHKGAGSSFYPSPDFRFGFNKPSTTSSTSLILLCDLEKKSIRDIHADGWPAGWWSDHQIVMLTESNDFSLFDVVTGISSPLLSASDITDFLDKHHINYKGQRPAPMLTWDGREFEFYVTDLHKKWSAEESFLLKVTRPDARLSVVKPTFKFEWSDHIDPSQQYYAYTGREIGQRSDGVFLRNLQTGAEFTLVEPLGERRMSVPQFYKDSVLYLRSNALWSVGMNGSNNVRLFP